MLALLHILTIKSDLICVKLHKTFSSEKIHAIQAKITSCNLVGIQQYGFVYLNESYQNLCV
jgi:hypothetical protein